MHFLILAILLSASLTLQLREYQQKGLALLPIIAFNYLTCGVVGLFYISDFQTALASYPFEVFLLGSLQGFMFITFFFLIGKAANELGVGYTTTVCRISLVLPILFSHFYFHEPLTTIQIIGLILSFLAIILMNLSAFSIQMEPGGHLKFLIFTLVLFVGNGLIDCIFKYFEFYFKKTVSNELFTLNIFSVAFLLGSIVMTLQVLKGDLKIGYKSVLAGIALGIPNFFSVIVLLAGLQIIPATVYFPANNIGLILLLTLIGYFYYKEKLTVYSISGLILASISIYLISS